MVMPGRTYASGNAYRYGFGGEEKSIEINSYGSSYTAEFWQYDARIGRRWNVDPVLKVSESPYAAFSNNPIINIDPHGNSDSTYKTPGGGRVTTDDPNAKTFDGRAYKVGKTTVQPEKGTLRSFTVTGEQMVGGAARFVAMFDTESGAFTGYGWDKNPSWTYADYLKEAGEDLISNLEHANDPMWDPDISHDQSGRNSLSAGVGLTLPTVLIKPLTIATGIQKVVNSPIGRTVADFVKLMKPKDLFDVTKTLYRGTTGSEAGSTVLFLTDDATVAASYIKNGGSVMKYEMSQFSIKSLEASGSLTFKTGIHGPTGQISREFMFTGKDLVEAVNSLATPLNH